MRFLRQQAHESVLRMASSPIGKKWTMDSRRGTSMARMRLMVWNWLKSYLRHHLCTWYSHLKKMPTTQRCMPSAIWIIRSLSRTKVSEPLRWQQESNINVQLCAPRKEMHSNFPHVHGPSPIAMDRIHRLNSNESYLLIIGWCSCFPSLTERQYKLQCSTIEVNDVCLPPQHPDASFTRKAVKSLTRWGRNIQHYWLLIYIDYWLLILWSRL